MKIKNITNHMMTFTIKTLGCKVNQYESDAIAEALLKNGIKNSKNNTADICIINTCTVTQKAAMQSRQIVRQLIRANPHAFIIITGCHAQHDPQDFYKISGVNIIAGNAYKHKIIEIIKDYFGKKDLSPLILHSSIMNEKNFSHMPVQSYGSKTRFFLKIQDGCNAFCNYCIVPYTRGPSRSLPKDIIIKQIQGLHKNGFNEIVLSGIHLGFYGLDLAEKTSLFELLKQIKTKTNIPRIRLSSIEPNEITDELISFIKETPMICRHLHIPLQSGDDYILKQMNRHYKRAFFKERVLSLLEEIPDIAIGLDLLMGTPGETNEHFENTLSLIDELDIAYLHVFPFSIRKGTPAAKFKNQISVKIIKERCKILRELGDKKRVNYYKGIIGKKASILIEEKRDGDTDLLRGLTSNYVPVYISGSNEIMNCIVEVNIKECIGKKGVTGDLIIPASRIQKRII